MHLSTSHTTRVVAECGFWACIYIYYSNLSSIVVNLWGLDIYCSNHTGSQTNVETNIAGTYGQMRTNGVYRQEATKIVYIREVKEQ